METYFVNFSRHFQSFHGSRSSSSPLFCHEGVGNLSKAEQESETVLSNYITDDKTEIKIHIKSNGTPKSANTSGPTSANPSDTERGEDDKD